MNTKEYRYIEYTDDHDFVIANVVMDEDKIVSCKLSEDYLTNKSEHIELLQFLDEIKSMPWKYDDNDQACEDWYTITNITSQVINTSSGPLDTVEQLGYLPTAKGDEIDE